MKYGTSSQKMVQVSYGETAEDVKKTALSQEEIDRYIQLCKAYSGSMIPLEVQLLAWEKEGEAPSGITLDPLIVGDLSVVDYIREVLELRKRKDKYGTQRGVTDPDDRIKLKERAVVIYTRCALQIAEAEAMRDAINELLSENSEQPVDEQMSPEQIEELKGKIGDGQVRVFFPAPDGAELGRNGYFPLFPKMKNTPVALYRGDGGAFDAYECIKFIGTNFPDVEDEFLNALAIDESE